MKAVIELAKQVGMQGMLTDVVTTVSELERFSELVRADERKRLMAVAGEPVAWANPNDLQNFDMKVRTNGGPLHTVPLYTAPPKRKWVGLTDEEMGIAFTTTFGAMNDWDSFVDGCNWAEEMLKEKNT